MPNNRPIAVVDLAYGDCGKGTIVDFLTRRCQATAVVRFNGGPQAGHNVVTPDGRHHTFSQFGSGSFFPGVKTVLSRFMLIEPYALLNESLALHEIGVADPLGRLVIDRNCLVITPAHQAANRLRELVRGDGAHGTCGMGVGEAVQDAIEHPDLALRANALNDVTTVRKRLLAIRDLKIAQIGGAFNTLSNHPRAVQSISVLLNDDWIDVAVDVYQTVASQAAIADELTIAEILRSGRIIFEGAQGILLDERYGFHPHTTWSTTTFANAQTILHEAGVADPPVKVGVIRTYFTRHGLGPFVTEDSSMSSRMTERFNGDTGWQGRFRHGSFDAVAARYALSVCGGLDALAVTHMDRLHLLDPRICTAYEELSGNRIEAIPLECGEDLAARELLTRRLNQCRPVYEAIERSPAEFIDRLEELLEVKVGITSSGSTADDKVMTDRALT